MFATATKSASLAFTSSNQLAQAFVKFEVPRKHTFKRLYLGWASWDAGDLVVEGFFRFKQSGRIVHQERFLWSSATLPSGYNTTSAEVFVPPFSVNRIAYVAGSSNVQPVAANIGPDARIFTVHYTDAALASFGAQVTCQAIRFPIESDELEVEINGRSGTIAGVAGYLICVVKLDSSSLPL